MRIKHVIGVAALGAVALAACGGTSYSSASAKHPSAKPVTSTSSANAVQSRSTSLGQVLVSSSGRTIYALTKDTKTNSTCVGACAQAWPPVLVNTTWTAAPRLDRSLFSTILRQDGKRQLVAGQWPLYTFSGDSKPGDVNGEGSGGVWFAVGTDGKLIKSAPSSATGTMANGGY